MEHTITDEFAREKKVFLEKMDKAEKTGGTKLILIIVANILDPHIGKGCAKDIESIQHMFSTLAKHMKFWFLELIIKGDIYNIKNVLDGIESIKPGIDDIVVFYYSGHGFRFERDDDEKYPHVYLQPTLPVATGPIINENSLNLKEIFDKVKGRGARLNIVIGDCCNTPIHFKRKFSGGDPKIKAVEPMTWPIDEGICKTLFCDLTASILVASADKDQFSITDDDLGSIFTFNFTENLKVLMSTPTGSKDGFAWHKFLEESQVKTFSLSKTYNIGDEKEVPGHQEPIFRIFTK